MLSAKNPYPTLDYLLLSLQEMQDFVGLEVTPQGLVGIWFENGQRVVLAHNDETGWGQVSGDGSIDVEDEFDAFSENLAARRVAAIRARSGGGGTEGVPDSPGGA